MEVAEDEHAEQLSAFRNQWWNARCLPRKSGETKAKNLRSNVGSKGSVRGGRGM